MGLPGLNMSHGFFVSRTPGIPVWPVHPARLPSHSVSRRPQAQNGTDSPRASSAAPLLTARFVRTL
jgi:1,2-phenylacetyl-CoA epoxidase PaaB subunit